jgi:hypothetical protein
LVTVGDLKVVPLIEKIKFPKEFFPQVIALQKSAQVEQTYNKEIHPLLLR